MFSWWNDDQPRRSRREPVKVGSWPDYIRDNLKGYVVGPDNNGAVEISVVLDGEVFARLSSSSVEILVQNKKLDTVLIELARSYEQLSVKAGKRAVIGITRNFS